MKLKEYKKQLNESIEVIDVHDAVISNAKANTNRVYNKKSSFNFKPILRIGISFCAFVLIGFIVINAINGGFFIGRKMNKAQEKEPFYNTPTIDEEFNKSESKIYETGSSSDITQPQNAPSEPEQYEEPGKQAPTYNDYIYACSVNGITNCHFTESEFYEIINLFMNGFTKSNIVTESTIPNISEYANELDIIKNLLN